MSTVPGSIVRRTLFWAHLVSGVAAGFIILVLSVTGVLLAYEHQINARAETRNYSAPPDGALPLPADRLATAAASHAEPGARISLVFENNLAAPVTVQSGRDTVALLNRHTGEVVIDQAQGTREFLRKIEDWHRWLAASPRGGVASLVDIANLLFLFMIFSGFYVWLPAVWRWRTVRGLVFTQSRYVNGKARDFNWHHVFSIWALIPLLLIAASGVVISYPWASNLVFAAYGEQPPQRSGPPGDGPPGGAGNARRDGNAPATGAAESQPLVSLEQVFQAASTQAPGWQRMTLPTNGQTGRYMVSAEMPGAGVRPSRQSIVVSHVDGTLSAKPMAAPGGNVQSPGQRARIWFRFIHTGEQYGVIGQTIAALASLAACFLVYTGLALAWRRLIRPLLR
jgi:uncharacterized iron-regulated membrane protein